jgi:hypothetical protein
MIPVAELDRLARARLEDAKALLAATRYDGAVYLCGYAVEVALKARTCRAIKVEPGSVEVKDSSFFGLAVRHAFIITSKRPQSPVPG